MKQIKRAKLHNALLVGKANLQDKLDVAARTGLKMMEDDKGNLYVYMNGEFARVRSAAVDHTVAFDDSDLMAVFANAYPNNKDFAEKDGMINYEPKAQKPQPAAKKGQVTAQASTPMGHVHAGVGAGKTND